MLGWVVDADCNRTAGNPYVAGLELLSALRPTEAWKV